MADPSQPDLIELERRVARLEQLVAAISRQLGVRVENPSDRKTVTEKVGFDWQSR